MNKKMKFDIRVITDFKSFLKRKKVIKNKGF